MEWKIICTSSEKGVTKLGKNYKNCYDQTTYRINHLNHQYTGTFNTHLIIST